VSGADGPEGASLNDRLAHAERIKREALIELRETRLKLQAAQVQIDALQQRLTLQTLSPEIHTERTESESDAAIGRSPSDSTASDALAAAEPEPSPLSERLQAYHQRLAAWNSALQDLHSNQQREWQELNEAREVLGRRQRAHDRNRQALEAALVSLDAERTALEAERASWQPGGEAWKREIENHRVQLNVAHRDAEILRRRFLQADEDLAQARSESGRLQGEINRLRAEAAANRRPAPSPAPAVVSRPAAHPRDPAPGSWRVLLQIRSEDLLRDLMAIRGKDLASELGSAVVTCGSGPWASDVLDAAAATVGFEPYFLDEAAHEVPVFVVGREGVDIELLRSQLDRRFAAGEPFWLFSQELFVLSVLCGHDLLHGAAAPTDQLVPEFAEDHPVLSQFLGGDEWQWPAPPEGNRGRSGEELEIDAGSSPLSNYGYRVGAKSEPAKVRQELLRSFWAEPSLDDWFQADHDAAYRKRWGSAGSGVRLTRMVRHIIWLQSTQGNDSRKSQAAQDWKSDLRWMRTHLVPEAGPRWRWPSMD
jgi:hypothetical protein